MPLKSDGVVNTSGCAPLNAVGAVVRESSGRPCSEPGPGPKPDSTLIWPTAPRLRKTRPHSEAHCWARSNGIQGSFFAADQNRGNAQAPFGSRCTALNLTGSAGGDEQGRANLMRMACGPLLIQVAHQAGSRSCGRATHWWAPGLPEWFRQCGWPRRQGRRCASKPDSRGAIRGTATAATIANGLLRCSVS